MAAIILGGLSGPNRTLSYSDPMGKAFCILGLLIGLCLILVFGMDLGTKIPFGGISQVMDIGFIVCGLILAYLSWTTFREQR